MFQIITFRELLEQPKQLVTDESFDVHDYLSIHLSNIIDMPYDFNGDKLVKVHVLKDFCYDGRRVWQLYYVTFKDQLVMFCSAAGREGHDNYSSRIFDAKALTDMVFHIAEKQDYYDVEEYKKIEFEAIYKRINELAIETTDLDEKADDFISFYSNKFNDVFDSW